MVKYKIGGLIEFKDKNDKSWVKSIYIESDTTNPIEIEKQINRKILDKGDKFIRFYKKDITEVMI